ncbi:hypothetical protein BB934_01195 [Microvirga ossetica]|uniref:Uncharacterized protein n=1 Tax=Microvirga ossetica TaxID=1882682 RepID=A0A1B2EAU1_9HYPH|nr:hypothetical protein [Microvirga ossetica]ANY77002.1 hypothetical protein BB934_01195 [Microvirga ossetica]
MSYASYQVATDGDQPDTSNHISPEDRSITIRTGGTVSYSGGEATNLSAYNSLNLADTDPSGGLQARTATGSPRYGTLQPTDIIQIAGTETTVANAEALGLVERDQHGRYIATPDGPSRALANEPQEEAPQEDQGEALSDATVEADLAALVQASTASTQFAILGQLVSDGEVNPNTMSRVSSELGIHPQEAEARLGKVIEGFKAQAVSTFHQAGIEDPEGFISWAQHNRPDDFKAAMHSHGVERTTKAYQPLVSEYLATIADRDPEAVLEAQLGSGITATKQGNTVILTIPGVGQVDFKTAVRERLITVRGA